MPKRGRYGAGGHGHGGDSLGSANLDRRFAAPGFVIAKGLRVQVRQRSQDVEAGTWGTVERFGLGTVKALLDDGRHRNFEFYNLSFQKGEPL